MLKSPAKHKRTVRIAVDVEPALLSKIEDDRNANGNCSRGAIIRMALRARYGLNGRNTAAPAEDMTHAR